MTRPIDCAQVIDKLLEYLDRELDETTEREISDHMEACRACFTRAEFERQLRKKVRQTGAAKAPDSLRRRIRTIVARY
jgi:anti-sigma factor (TIGR02949 family)